MCTTNIMHKILSYPFNLIESQEKGITSAQPCICVASLHACVSRPSILCVYIYLMTFSSTWNMYMEQVKYT